MYNIFFYKDKKGNEPVKEYIISLKKKNSKDSLIKLQKNTGLSKYFKRKWNQSRNAFCTPFRW